MNSGLWDTNLGGGFWWSTDKTVKPTQSNGLALQLFLRLYQITGKSYYSQWATSIKSWLETKMLNGNNNNGLYIWEIKSDGTVETTNFTYDNSIMIEADLLWANIMKDSTYVTKAESIANALNSVLWDSTYKVYQFNTGDSRVNPTWCVWASEAPVRLYQADANTTWLDYAQNNIDFMNTYLRNTTNYGYYQWCNHHGNGPIHHPGRGGPGMDGEDTGAAGAVSLIIPDMPDTRRKGLECPANSVPVCLIFN